MQTSSHPTLRTHQRGDKTGERLTFPRSFFLTHNYLLALQIQPSARLESETAADTTAGSASSSLAEQSPENEGGGVLTSRIADFPDDFKFLVYILHNTLFFGAIEIE